MPLQSFALLEYIWVLHWGGGEMTSVTRRSALIMGALAASASYALGQDDERQEQVDILNPSDSPVVFWHNVAQELNAFDHSFVNEEAMTLPRAVGPVAAARALALIHAVLADAVLSTDTAALHKPQFTSLAAPGDVKVPDLFVGGAVSSIVNFIYTTSPHAGLIKTRENEFIRDFADRAFSESDNQGSWRQGMRFGADTAFRRLWNWPEIFAAIRPDATDYTPVPGSHDVDPLNCEQGFYGQTYALKIAPLVITQNEAETFVEPPPTLESDRYKDDFAEVRSIGRLPGDSSIPDLGDVQKRVGIFWAYDAARFVGTPSRLYNQIILETAIRDGMTAVELARLLALSNIAMSDAANAAWFAKYEYKYARPILAIRNGTTDTRWLPVGSPKTNSRLADPNEVDVFTSGTHRDITVQDVYLGKLGGALASGKPLATDKCDKSDAIYSSAAFTPNFPAYPSGHATIGAAAFHILRKVREEREATKDLPDQLGASYLSDELNGSSIDNFLASRRPVVLVNSATITDLIKANSESRVHLGVHWRFDSEEGEAAGIRVADAVFSRAYVQ